ncbi:retrovirus-related pol polyprotein from transposon TNT 1-94 [Tanacetum coccineum]
MDNVGTSIKKHSKIRDDKNDKSDRKCFRCGDLNHLIRECPKPPKDKNQRAFVEGSWSDSGEEMIEKEMRSRNMCLIQAGSIEELLETYLRCLELLHMDLFGPSSVRSYGGNRYTLVIVDDTLRKILNQLKTPMSSDTKLTKDEECESVDSTKYRGMIGLWYPKGTGIETIVYADSDHAVDYVDRKSTSEDGQVRRIRHEEEIDILEYQVLTHEIKPTLKPLEEIIQENVFCLGGNWDHVPACLCYMLYYVDNYEKVHHLPIDGNANGRWITKQSGLIYPMRMPRKGSLAEEEVITHLLILCPLTNHLLLISNDDDDDVGNGRS